MDTSDSLVLEHAPIPRRNLGYFFRALPAEARFLLHAVNPEHPDAFPETNEQLITQPGFSWDRVLKLSRKHGATPLLHKHIKHYQPYQIPESFRTQIQQDFHQIGLLISIQSEMLKKMVLSFDAADLQMIVFKGLPLGELAYGGAIWRKPGDIDILIHAHHFAPARHILTTLGFETRMSRKEERQQLDLQQQLTFYGKTTDVDLHFSLQQRSFLKMPYAATFDTENVWKRMSTVTMGGAGVPCLSPEDLFNLLCIHGAKHGWYRLYMLVDLAMMMTNVEINWQKVSIRARRIKAERMLGLGVLLAHKLFGIPIPQPIGQTIRNDANMSALANLILRRLFDDKADDKALQFHRIQTGLFPKWSEKARYLGYVTAEHWKRRWRVQAEKQV